MDQAQTFRPGRAARWMTAVAGACLALTVGGCALAPQERSPASVAAADWILTGEGVFGEPVAAAEAPEVAVAAPSQAMRDYVTALMAERGTSPARTSAERFRRLFIALQRDGYFDAVYAADLTLTAAEAFEARGGNCLSYTNMFIALARQAGLDAVYQIVDVPPTWDADAGFLIRYNHINVLLRDVGPRGRPGERLTVDFNVTRPDEIYPRRAVSDDHAKALYYANHSVALLRQGRLRESFAYLRRALEAAPEDPDLWINLGAFYATQGFFDASAAAYHRALELDGNDRAALSGLARSYANAGDEAMAALYRQKVRNYRETNPYFHFAMAQTAFEQARYQRSLDFINAAIALERRAPRFHLLKALVEQQLGDLDAAEESIARARRLGLDPGAETHMMQSLVGMSSS
jgi:tetratricopeptide (TPR) repeat protein